MQLILHTGAHYTEEDRLLKSLQSNHDLLAQAGTHVPSPATYRGLFRDTLNAMYKTPPQTGRGMSCWTRSWEILTRIG